LALAQAQDARPAKQLRAGFLQGSVRRDEPEHAGFRHRKFNYRFMNPTYHTSKQHQPSAVLSSVWSCPLTLLAVSVCVSDARLVTRFVSDMVIEVQGGSSG